MTGPDPLPEPLPEPPPEPSVEAGPVLLDVTGLRCPLPVIRLARLARELPAGSVVEVRSTDPAAGPDLAAWCRMRGADLLDQQPAAEDAAVLVSRVRLGG